MKYIVEKDLSEFDFWSGAKDNASKLTSDELDQLDRMMDELFPGETPTDTQVNDLFWFEFETVADMLGLKLNSDGDIIRGIDDVDDDDIESAVSDWAADDYDLDPSQVRELAEAIKAKDGITWDDGDIEIDNSIGAQCAYDLGYAADDDSGAEVDAESQAELDNLGK